MTTHVHQCSRSGRPYQHDDDYCNYRFYDESIIPVLKKESQTLEVKEIIQYSFLLL